MSSDLYTAPPIEELEEFYRGKNICIVAQGPSGKHDFSQYKDERVTGDEPWYVWTQNGGWTYHPCSTLAFMMDDMRSSVWDNIARWDRSDVERFTREAKLPIITSVAYPEFPNMLEFPMARAIQELPKVNDSLNLNETINYMVALCIMWKVKRIDMWGVDYLDFEGRAIRPDKRACCEFWIGMAAMSGIEVRTHIESSVMRYGLHDPDVEIEGLYGYQAGSIPGGIAQNLELQGAGRAKIKIGGLNGG